MLVVGEPAVPEDVDSDVAGEEGAVVVGEDDGVLGDQPQDPGDGEARSWGIDEGQREDESENGGKFGGHSWKYCGIDQTSGE